MDSTKSLEELAEIKIRQYLNAFDQSEPSNVYQNILQMIEPPLLRLVYAKYNGNISKASLVLGISRPTLRQKLHRYNII